MARARTVLQVAQDMFGDQEGYSRIMAIDEAGAHVEYLHALGQLRIANLDEVAVRARSRHPVRRAVEARCASGLVLVGEGVELFVGEALAALRRRARARTCG